MIAAFLLMLILAVACGVVWALESAAAAQQRVRADLARLHAEHPHLRSAD